MGTYWYRITSKTRKLRVVGNAAIGEKATINLLAFEGKKSSWPSHGRAAALEAAREARLANIWAGRKPDYVAYDIENGAHVRSNWGVGQTGCTDDHSGEYLRFEGEIVGDGRDAVFERWHAIEIPMTLNNPTGAYIREYDMQEWKVAERFREALQAIMPDERDGMRESQIWRVYVHKDYQRPGRRISDPPHIVRVVVRRKYDFDYLLPHIQNISTDVPVFQRDAA